MKGGVLGTKIRRGDQDFRLQITSLIDTLVIILVFMLMSVGAGSVNLEMASNIQLPWARAGAELAQGVKLVAKMDGLYLGEEKLLPMKNGVIPGDAVSEGGRKIEGLFQKLAGLAAESKAAARRSKVRFEGKVLMQADKGIPLKTVKQILYTAARAGYNDFKFAALLQ